MMGSTRSVSQVPTATGNRSRGIFLAKVRANVPLCREHYRLVLGLSHFPATDPGQFIQIACRSAVERGPAVWAREAIDGVAGERELDWSADRGTALHGAEMTAPLAVLRRPFSLAGRRDSGSGVELDIIHRVVGIGTDWLSRLTPDDTVDLLGPLGNRFALPSSGESALLVGGGVGIPPMIYLAERLANQNAVVFSGALTRDLLPLALTETASNSAADATEPRLNVTEFARHGIPAVISTDDGSYGFRGYVTQALEHYLDRQPTRDEGNPKPVIYTCGPELMMKRVADIAAARGLECQVAVERAMACGMGTCQSCCIRVRKPDPAAPPLVGREWCYRLACTDGPVFRGADLLW